MRFVFVMDPVSTVIVDEDTSFALMLEAQARGHRVDHCLASDVGLRGRRVVARVRQATMQLGPGERDKRIRELAAAYASRLEHYCIAAPYQWFNFFDYWREGAE